MTLSRLFQAGRYAQGKLLTVQPSSRPGFELSITATATIQMFIYFAEMGEEKFSRDVANGLTSPTLVPT